MANINRQPLKPMPSLSNIAKFNTPTLTGMSKISTSLRAPNGNENVETQKSHGRKESRAKRTNGLIPKPSSRVRHNEADNSKVPAVSWYGPDDGFVPTVSLRGRLSFGKANSNGDAKKAVALPAVNEARGRGRGRTFPAWMTQTEQQDFMTKTNVDATNDTVSKPVTSETIGAPTVPMATEWTPMPAVSGNARGRGRGRTLPAWMTHTQKENIMSGSVPKTVPSNGIAKGTKIAKAGAKRSIDEVEDTRENHPYKICRISMTDSYGKAIDENASKVTTEVPVVIDLTLENPNDGISDTKPLPIVLDLNAIGSQQDIAHGVVSTMIKVCSVCHKWKPKSDYTKGQWKPSKSNSKRQWQWKGGNKKRACKDCAIKHSTAGIEKFLAKHKEAPRNVQVKVIPVKAVVIEKKPQVVVVESPSVDDNSSAHSPHKQLVRRMDKLQSDKVSVGNFPKRFFPVPDKTQSVRSDPSSHKKKSSLPSGWDNFGSPKSLPIGWNKFLDPKYGRYYYHNSADGTTHRERPSLDGQPAEPTGRLPPGWTVHVHPQYQEYCYYNASQGWWEWERPVMVGHT